MTERYQSSPTQAYPTDANRAIIKLRGIKIISEGMETKRLYLSGCSRTRARTLGIEIFNVDVNGHVYED